MIRNVLAVIAGYAAWTAVFFASAAGIRSAMPEVHDDAGFTSNTTALVLYLVGSFAASLLAGFIAARTAQSTKLRWVWITALALLATGVPVQLSPWDQLPLWYNLVFLVLLVPLTLAGGRVGGIQDEAP